MEERVLNNKRYYLWLVFLLSLFGLRIVGQLIQYIAETSYLPPFSEWQGSSLPYPALFGAQLLIFLSLTYTIYRIRVNRIEPRKWKHTLSISIGSIYFTVMAARLIMGQTILSGDSWFDKPIPATFHLVLASFIIILGFYLKALHENQKIEQSSEFSFLYNIIPATAYPVTITVSFCSFYLIHGVGVNMTLSAYLAVTIAAVIITTHELILPYRRDWRPELSNIISDSMFMVLIQIALPILLSLSLVLWITDWFASNQLAIGNLWPKDLPISIQLVMMIVLAEFPRYWIHRTFHTVTKMWEFHAVHHSPKKLYWFNVGRFHPIDKALQYCVDALPFALLGLSTEVLAAYFVFYAVNGFYQHSNCNVRLGILNFIISGPELHRWHHSRKASESNNNYGNNLIIWDLIFGTRFLPSNEQVGKIGLYNRDYPQGFFRQMITPFISGLDKKKR